MTEIKEARQYCRYCNNLVTGNGIYCTELHKEMSEAQAKRVNKCKSFNLNRIDAFGENEKGYVPRDRSRGCDGQLKLF
jgi:hypothetical protein